MIYCPQCGTPNKPNSKFCKNCGALLAPSTDVRCPICGTMNPQGAATCKNCNTRLVTHSVGGASAEHTTPADAPENIAPFNPPPAAPENAGTAGEEPAPAQPAFPRRPAFSQSSSDWLRRVKKSPPDAPVSEPPPAPPQTPSSEPVPPPVTAANDAPEWLREIQSEAEQQAAQAKAASSVPAAEPSKPVLGEIRLTSDSYDYSDIGGEVTEEMKAQLAAQAPKVESVEDEVALARRLLGLEVEEPPPAAVQAPAAEKVEPKAEAQPSPPVAAAESTTQVALPGTPAVAKGKADETGHAGEPDSDWLVKLAAASSAAVAAQVVHTEPEAHAAPAGLETSAETTTPKESQASGTETAEKPAAAAPEELAVAELPASVPPEVDKLATATAGTRDVAAAADATLETGELPEWLRDLSPTEQGAEGGEIPGWVKELEPGPAIAGTSALISPLPDLDEQEKGDLPEWLREPVAPEPEPTAPAPVAETAGTEPPLELPDWVIQSAAAPLRDPFEIVETTGPLAGVSNILPLALAIVEPHTLTSPAPTRTDSGRVFQSLLTEPLAARLPTETEAQGTRWLTFNHLIYLVILLAALIPLFFAYDQAGLGLSVIDSNTPSAGFADQLQAVPAEATVLMAFDYTPGQAPELDPAARVIVNDLAARKANVIAVTTKEQGSLLAQMILERARETNSQFTFVNAGYLTGKEIGLADLAHQWLPPNLATADGTAWSTLPLAHRIGGMNDLALVVVLAGDNAALQAWLSQVQPLTRTPMIAATTAAIEPQTRPFVNSGQLRASLHGLAGAAELELLSKNLAPAYSGLTVKTVDALSFVSLALAGIIIVANIVWLLRRNKPANAPAPPGA